MKSLITAVFAIFAILSGAAFAQTPAPAPPATSTENPEIRDLQKVEDSWSSALNQRDQYGLELVLSPLFVNVSATGEVTTRNQQVAGLLNESDKTAATDMHVVTVRMLGDVAVANGTYSFTHKGTSGQMEEKGVFTHVFQRQHGNWVCLNAQRTLLREDAPGKAAKTKAKSQSKAELPFHIPLFSKGDKSSGPTTSDAPKQ
jgi:ketosteroid isomerase-like protein